MSKRDPTAALRQMPDHAREAVLLAQGKTRAEPRLAQTLASRGVAQK